MLVVGAALVRDGRVLAAHRRRPVGWEFPGGKVDPGELPAAAIERECREELAVKVVARSRIATGSDARIELQLWHVELVDGEPRALQDHDELRWLGADDLEDLDWLEIDRGMLAAVRELLDP